MVRKLKVEIPVLDSTDAKSQKTAAQNAKRISFTIKRKHIRSILVTYKHRLLLRNEDIRLPTMQPHTKPRPYESYRMTTSLCSLFAGWMLFQMVLAGGTQMPRQIPPGLEEMVSVEEAAKRKTRWGFTHFWRRCLAAVGVDARHVGSRDRHRHRRRSGKLWTTGNRLLWQTFASWFWIVGRTHSITDSFAPRFVSAAEKPEPGSTTASFVD